MHRKLLSWMLSTHVRLVSVAVLTACSSATPTITPTPTPTLTPVYTITPIIAKNLEPITPQPVAQATALENRIYPTPIMIPTFGLIEITVTPGPLCVGSCASIIIDNDTGGTLSIRISGPESVTMQIELGTKTIPVPPGTYTLLVTASCGSTSDTFTLGAGQSESVQYYCTTAP